MTDETPDPVIPPEAAYERGIRETAERIAKACERDATYDVAARYHFARIARDTGKGDS